MCVDGNVGLTLESTESSILKNQVRGYNTFFMLTSTEHEIQLLIKTKMATNKEVSCFKSLKCCIYHAN